MAARSMARPDAREIRSKAVKIGGRKRNVGRVIKKGDRYVFFYKNNPIICIYACETGGEVVDVLREIPLTEIDMYGHESRVRVPDRVTQLLNGERFTALNWSCEKVTSDKEPESEPPSLPQLYD
jgi:hypothetical protein